MRSLQERAACVRVATELQPRLVYGGVPVAISILEQITDSVSPSLISRLASYGDSQSAVTKGIAATIPVVLGSVTSRAQDEGFMSQVHALATDAANDPTLIDDPTRLADRGTPPMRDGGLVERFRWLTVGASPTRLLDAIASYAGVQPATASSILMAVIPMV